MTKIKTEPKPKLKLTGKDGNAFSIMGLATQALRRAGASQEHIAKYTKKKIGHAP